MLTKRAEIPGVKDFEIFHDCDGAGSHSTHIKMQKEPSIESLYCSSPVCQLSCDDLSFWIELTVW